MAKPVVLIAEQLSPATVEALGPDFDIREVDGTDRPALLSALADASAVLIRSATQIDAEAIAAAKKLKVVARAGVGLDNVDLPAATNAGVMVVNAPTSNIISAAELTIGHILSLARHIPAAHASLAQGQWKRSKFTGTELYEKRVGIIGLGRIGALIAARLQAFGVDVVAYDPYVTATRAQQLGVTLLTLDELLATSDFVTIHMPKTPETTGMIGAEQLKAMKKTAYVINVARGGLIDEEALAAALKAGEIAGAGIDVFTSEPPTDDVLTSAPNILVTPHLGASTDEAQEKAGVSVAKSVRLALDGELVPDAVNVAGGAIDPFVRPGISLVEKLAQVLRRRRRQDRPDRPRGRRARRARRVRRQRVPTGRPQGLLHQPGHRERLLRQRARPRRAAGHHVEPVDGGGQQGLPQHRPPCAASSPTAAPSRSAAPCRAPRWSRSSIEPERLRRSRCPSPITTSSCSTPTAPASSPSTARSSATPASTSPACRSPAAAPGARRSASLTVDSPVPDEVLDRVRDRDRRGRRARDRRRHHLTRSA